MANSRPCMAQLSRLCTPSSLYGRPNAMVISMGPLLHVRHAAFKAPIASKKPTFATSSGAVAAARKKKAIESAKRKKARTTYLEYDMKDLQQFSLLEAMRYLRAFEVGQKPTSAKYELAVKLKSPKNGPVIRNRLRLPHPVKTDIRICVICPPDSKYAEAARAAGASLVGEEDVFEAVKDGRIEFDRCICQTDSLPKLNKSGIARILGPRGLQPNAKLGTVVRDPASAVRDMAGGAEYREKLGVLRMAIGQLGFTPEEVQRNIKTFMESVKKDMAQLSDKINKEISEVVLSSTRGPGFSLSGDFKSPDSKITSRELSTM